MRGQSGNRLFYLDCLAAEEVHPDSKLGNRRVQHQFLAHLQQLLPSHTPIVVADSGFRVPFFREVERLGWHWLGRIRNRDFIAFADHPDDLLAAKSLYAKATRKAKLLGSARWVRSNPLSGQLVTFYRPAKGRKQLTVRKRPAKSKQSRQQAKREKEPWLLVVSPSLKAFSAVRIVDYYRAWMQIEINQPCCLHKSVLRKSYYRFCDWFYPGTINSPQFT